MLLILKKNYEMLKTCYMFPHNQWKLIWQIFVTWQQNIFEIFWKFLEILSFNCKFEKKSIFFEQSPNFRHHKTEF